MLRRNMLLAMMTTLMMTTLLMPCMSQSAVAGLFRVAAREQAEQPATPQEVLPPIVEQADPAPAPSLAPASSGCKRCITYRNHRLCRQVCCDCGAPSQAVLLVKDPCCCDVVPVSVCLPSCCKGAPDVSCRRGLFGRSIVEYQWCCGYKVRVVFDRCGDLIVHTYGAV